MTRSLLFSERLEVADKALEYCKRNHLATNYRGIVHALNALGYLKVKTEPVHPVPVPKWWC